MPLFKCCVEFIWQLWEKTTAFSFSEKCQITTLCLCNCVCNLVSPVCFEDIHHNLYTVLSYRSYGLVFTETLRNELSLAWAWPAVLSISFLAPNFEKICQTWARIFKRLWSPGIESKEWIPPAYVTRYDNPIPIWFLAPIDCLKIPALSSSFCLYSFYL